MISRKWNAKVILCAVLMASVLMVAVSQCCQLTFDKPKRQLIALDPKSIEKKSTQKNKLEFVHITKTGGSAIEKAANKHGVIWGSCHWESSHRCVHTRSGDLLSENLPFKDYWHMPHTWLPSPFYRNSDTFLVIRDPYDRTVSEYNYLTDSSFTPRPEMNSWIIEKLKWREKVYSDMPKRGGHFARQFEYVFDSSGEKIVTHVLRYENLAEDFNKLMTEYNLPINLTNERDLPHNTKERGSKKNLSNEAIEAINNFYRKDFELLGYQMVKTASNFSTS